MTIERYAQRTLAASLLLLSLGAEANAAEERPAGPAHAAQPNTGRERLSFAVVIGNNKSLGRRRPELHYADDDAARYFEILQTMAPGRVSLLASFDRDTERLFPDAKAHALVPSRANLDAVGRRLATEVRAAHA